MSAMFLNLHKGDFYMANLPSAVQLLGCFYNLLSKKAPLMSQLVSACIWANSG